MLPARILGQPPYASANPVEGRRPWLCTRGPAVFLQDC